MGKSQTRCSDGTGSWWISESRRLRSTGLTIRQAKAYIVVLVVLGAVLLVGLDHALDGRVGACSALTRPDNRTVKRAGPARFSSAGSE